MSFIASAYDLPESIPEAMGNRLKVWLSMEEWHIYEATQIIANIDPDESYHQGIFGTPFSWLTLFSGYQAPECYPDSDEVICGCEEKECVSCGTTELRAYAQKCKDTAKLLSKPSEKLTFASPQEWIERALSKKIAVPWLGWAKEHGLLANSVGEIAVPMEQNMASEDKPISTTERNTLLTIIAALCEYSAIKHQERGAAVQIANMTEEIGASVSDDTIRKMLAKIPNALETRMK